MATSPSSAFPEFNPSGSRFDQSTFMGRWRHFMQVVNPLTLLTTDKELADAQQLLAQFDEGAVPAGTTIEDLWAAKRVKDAVIHPDTGEKIPLMFRMSAFAPTNVPLCVLMLWPNAGTGLTIFGQWLNQSYNVGCNYANRNASNEQSLATIGGAYAAGTAVALSVALGARKFMAKNGHKFPPIAARMVPYFAVAAAGTAGMVIMRYKEYTEGIHLKDKYGDGHGQSKKAGILAVAKTAVSRAIFFPIFPMVIPPLVVDVIKRVFPAVGKNPRLSIPIETAAIAGCMLGFLPMAIAMFPQEESVSAALLEKEFAGLLDRKGEPITEFYFNKGL